MSAERPEERSKRRVGNRERRQAVSPRACNDWPTFAIRYTYNPNGVGLDEREVMDTPEDVVLFDISASDVEKRWLSAGPESCVDIEEVR